MSRKTTKVILFSFLLLISILLSATLVSQVSFGGTVSSCVKAQVKVNRNNKTLVRDVVRCSMRLRGGRKGDLVEIRNKYNYLVAEGYIEKRRKRGRRASVILTSIYKPVETGDPVVIKNRDNEGYWTAGNPN